jgi:hypothetical protein
LVVFHTAGLAAGAADTTPEAPPIAASTVTIAALLIEVRKLIFNEQFSLF